MSKLYVGYVFFLIAIALPCPAIHSPLPLCVPLSLSLPVAAKVRGNHADLNSLQKPVLEHHR